MEMERPEIVELFCSALMVATTPAKRACSVCGTLLADDSEYCPVCALRCAVETQSDSGTDISSELRFEHYQVLRNQDGKPLELGHGGMGVTYKAIDTRLGCAVALKIIGTQCLGVDQIFKDWAKQGLTDQQILTKGCECFDALYAQFKRP